MGRYILALVYLLMMPFLLIAALIAEAGVLEGFRK